MVVRLFRSARFVVSIACLFGVSAHAAGSDAVSDILAEQQKIHAAIVEGDAAYAGLDAFKRSRILAAQNRVFESLEDGRGFDRLAPDTQLQVFNDLKKISSLLGTGDVGDAIICERVAITGTRRYQMACMTGEERERRAEAAKKVLMERAACTTQDCIGG